MVAEESKVNFMRLYDTGRVRRFHTLADYSDKLTQSNAEHAWGVALIVMQIYLLLDTAPRPAFLRTVLLHDAEEQYTGDVPATAKWRWPKLAQELAVAEAEVRKDLWLRNTLSEEEKLILKWADALELYLHARRKVRDGVKAYTAVAKNIREYSGSLKPLPYAARVWVLEEFGVFELETTL